MTEPDACYTQTLPSGDTACIRESHTGRPCRYVPPFEPEETR